MNDKIDIEEQEFEESQLFQLKDGRYILDEEQSKIFSTIISERPHCNFNYKWDEIAMAELFAKCYSHNTLYCPESRQWYIYNGSVWEKDTGAIKVCDRLKEFSRLMALYCNEISEDDLDIKKKYTSFIAKLGDRRVRDRILKDAQSEAVISIVKFDCNPYLINCENGTYDLEHNSFHFHKAEDYLTMETNCTYLLPTTVVEFDRWEKFIDEITCNDKELALYLQKCLGYSLVGVANEECMFVAYGKTTRNGKGTLLNTIHNILGDYGNTIDVSFICQNKSGRNFGGANPMICSLKSTRFLTMSESDDTARLDESAIKNYTGGDPISTRQLYGEAFNFVPQFTMWLSCNTLPEIRDKSLFSSDRIKVIRFNKHFSEAERDTRLKEKFQTPEAKSVIFKWLLEGYSLYKKQGLVEPDLVKQDNREYEKANDIVEIFIEEMCEAVDNVRINRLDFYNAFKIWCKTNGVTCKSAHKFYEDCERLSIEIVKTNGLYCFKDIKLKNTSSVKIK